MQQLLSKCALLKTNHISPELINIICLFCASDEIWWCLLYSLNSNDEKDAKKWNEIILNQLNKVNTSNVFCFKAYSYLGLVHSFKPMVMKYDKQNPTQDITCNVNVKQIKNAKQSLEKLWNKFESLEQDDLLIFFTHSPCGCSHYRCVHGGGYVTNKRIISNKKNNTKTLLVLDEIICLKHKTNKKLYWYLGIKEYDGSLKLNGQRFSELRYCRCIVIL
eukprot:435632_1